MRITKGMIESLKTQFGLDGWTIVVKKKRGTKGDNLGDAIILARFRKAQIRLYPDNIKGERAIFPDETQEKVIKHELGEVLMAMYEDILPDAVVESEAFAKYKDATADHVARIVGKK